MSNFDSSLSPSQRPVSDPELGEHFSDEIELPEPIIDEADLILPSASILTPQSFTEPESSSPPALTSTSTSTSTTNSASASASTSTSTSTSSNAPNPLNSSKLPLPRDRVPIPLPPRPVIKREKSAPAPPPFSATPSHSLIDDGDDDNLPALPVADDDLNTTAPSISHQQQAAQRSTSQALPISRSATTPLPLPMREPPVPPNVNTEASSDTNPIPDILRAPVGGLSQVYTDTAYAFNYGDADSLPRELDEWFGYGIEERARIARSQASFGVRWAAWRGVSPFGGVGAAGEEWISYHKRNDEDEDTRSVFIREVLEGLERNDKSAEERMRDVETLVYVALGVWGETAGLENGTDNDEGYEKSSLHIEWIRRNTETIVDAGGIPIILNLFKKTTERACAPDTLRTDILTIQDETEQRETWCAMTLLYVCLEVVRTCQDERKKLLMREKFLKSKPNLLILLEKIINALRFDDSIKIPLVRIISLMWKATLVMIGGLEDVKTVKESFQEIDPARNQTSKPIITASPLDYHSFRQEISSKYPSYNPPPTVFPMEPDQKSILPPPRHNSIRQTSVQARAAEHGGSILNQPVHIATPAPSPPPSPAAGGKGGKKHNYQTNNMFPFLYPPLDSNSNQLGGKGSTFLQDSLVDKKWTGMDIPSSILEASELFKSRVRATRALSQLWEERGYFLKYERGWDDGIGVIDDKYLPEPDDFHLDEESLKFEPTQKPSIEEERIMDGSVHDRLESVEEFYRDGLPHLQSTVMVIVRTILANLTTLITQTNLQNFQNGVTSTFTNGTQQENGVNGGESNRLTALDISHLTIEEIDAIRTQEITAKAASGLLLMMLKWFKLSHILKFEYLTQLLVDANYMPIILKLVQTQEIERLINCKADREDSNFLYYCRTLSRNWEHDEAFGSKGRQYTPESSDDEALPPPIKRNRDPIPETNRLSPASRIANGTWILPEVDELGIPLTEMPSTPITHFSWRNLFGCINFLRILQKICKGKAHRNLMLVTYKSATYLKKALRVPQKELRLYTLKLYKNQVPYCGRKWRQANMRVITAVYLHCRPELRDDWLLSAEVDVDVEMSVPMEQSLRSLTHYYNLRRYAKQMGAKNDILHEQDFFVMELERMEWAGDDILEEEGDDIWEAVSNSLYDPSGPQQQQQHHL